MSEANRFIADCMRNYAEILRSGLVDGAGHYFPEDIEGAADAVDGGSWQTIETAPKNTAVLVCSMAGVGEACFIEYVDGPSGWYWAADRDPMGNNPTHWQPLPTPPKPSSEPTP